ncbi:uncharacterized protein EV154DRAFT_513249 [Mucor mucedo]|uniref:uncharacterized protein n=1 Tax=Mucor mucedo TaxID=29922 RepID=UPI00221F498B|nr:uncharacterized protein EV154DRAFT_513249 [Mucor mucedo]KAI7889889.1 hypothetical protein EV154DRAFT_513249 [Mucor mucedo]
MGQSKSKENNALSKSTHFSPKEIQDLRQRVNSQDQDKITEDVFKNSVKQYLPTVSANDEPFLKRLYAAFGGDREKSIDFREFVDGLSIFVKGTADEKLKLSFKLYDVDKDGFISKTELEQVMLQLSQMSDEDRSEEVQCAIDCMFRDLDVDCDGKLSFEEYKLSEMKEPLVVDFLEEFLSQHNLSEHSTVPSPNSNRSGASSPTTTTTATGRPVSVHRLSQAELLDYSHHQQQKTPSPKPSFTQPLTPIETTPPPLEHRPSLPHRLSRGASMPSLDVAMTHI